MSFSRKRYAGPNAGINYAANALYRHPKLPSNTAAKKKTCSIRSVVPNDPTVAPNGPSIVLPIAAVEASVVIAVIVATAAIVVRVVAMEDPRLRTLRITVMNDRILTNAVVEGALHHRAASETYTCQRVEDAVVATDAVTGPANAVDHLRREGLGRQSVAGAVRPLRAAQEAHRDTRVEVHLDDPGPRLVAPVVLPRGLLRVAIELEVATGTTLRVTTVEGCAGLVLGLLRPETIPARRQSGSRALALGALRAANENTLNQDPRNHGL